MTPSGRADTTSSSTAKLAGAVPSQRSGAALRLLVLGTGDGAAAFREQAALSGAQLAQRFSVRVTHVVVETGIGEQDARVVRARTAGVPVLGLLDAERLLKEEQAEEAARDTAVDDASVEGERRGTAVHDAGAQRAEAARGDAGARSETRGGVEAGTLGESSRVGTQGDGSRLAQAAQEPERGLSGDSPERESPSAGSTDEPLSASSDPLRTAPMLSLIRHRAEFVPEPSDVRPSDVFTESALEAILHFPPLPAKHDSGVDGAVDADEAEPAEVVGGTAAVRAERDAAETSEQEAPGASELDASEVPAEAQVRAQTRPPASRRLGGGTAASVAWASLPLVSIGLLTPVGMGYAAYRLRSRTILVATACYTLAVGAAFALSAAAPMRTGTHAASGELLAACVGVSWLGGTAHSFAIRRRVFR